VTSGGDNLVSDASCFPALAALNDRVGLEPRLDALADNGGPTKTIALQADSPAIDQVIVNAPGCSGTDQRGVARPLGLRCDIGAFELPTRYSPTPSNDVVHASQIASIDVATQRQIALARLRGATHRSHPTQRNNACTPSSV
jgi:hypothetical protein